MSMSPVPCPLVPIGVKCVLNRASMKTGFRFLYIGLYKRFVYWLFYIPLPPYPNVPVKNIQASRYNLKLLPFLSTEQHTFLFVMCCLF